MGVASNKQSNQSYGEKMDILPKLKVGQSLIKCTYDIKDDSETQIINDIYENEFVFLINEEIQKKIKIWNNNKTEKLIYRKSFNKLGTNTIYFIIEEKLNDMIFIFNECISLILLFCFLYSQIFLKIFSFSSLSKIPSHPIRIKSLLSSILKLVMLG